VEVVVLPGGFSYGDYLRCGAIARFAPIMSAVQDFARAGGCVIGICNGFQILCEAGLLPGVLLRNSQPGFLCKSVYICRPGSGKAHKIPIAHGEGNYFCSPQVLQELKENGQIVFQYCTETGQVTTDVNPNGSLLNIAGICNAGKNVFGMMPHPERAVSPWQNNTDGLEVLKMLLS
jgi:phosphoribosylformylglycinamidine synthase